MVSRRTILKGAGAAAALWNVPGLMLPALAGDKMHGLSVFGDLKYPSGFSHFDYVSPQAPKGGRINYRPPSWGYNQNVLTYNTFNSFILKGDAPPRMEMCFDTLMTRALDEPDAMYGLLAESVEIADDGNTYVFNLRPEAKFHNESKLTAEDVAFSLMLLKADGHPQISQTLRELVDTEVMDETRVAVRFSGKQTRHLPLFVAGLPIFSKRYYTDYDFKQSTLTPPLSSGPYRVGSHAVGRYVEYEKVTDYWAKDLPVVVGHYNFDIIRIDLFRERQAGFEAFKKGEITFQEEFTSKIWATGYDFPAVEEGRVVREEIVDNRPAGAQGWYFNTRRDKFKDPRVRKAIGYAFDFEWTNQVLFYGLYTRSASYFENSNMKAEGTPPVEELALLEPFRDRLPAEVFEEAAVPPVSDGSGFDRSLLRQATRLLSEAGYKRDGSVLKGPDGKPLKIEFLDNAVSFKRVVQPFVTNLERLGIEATFRLVDPAQYQSRVNDFDFDVVTQRLTTGATLSDTIRQMWGSGAASQPGSHNRAGDCRSGGRCPDRNDTGGGHSREDDHCRRALDRVLRAGYYSVPHWYNRNHLLAYWDMFGRPDKPPFYDLPVETTWWVDTEKAKKIGKGS
ncbi:extracellular solute-binding protein [uncultured Roseibium sp.]|uniref:extracellular solute-binding protein n=1 Tax=uncultured Roseibium sp. TaxID=1936171 RepID=UPI0032177DC3